MEAVRFSLLKLEDALSSAASLDENFSMVVSMLRNITVKFASKWVFIFHDFISLFLDFVINDF